MNMDFLKETFEVYGSEMLNDNQLIALILGEKLGDLLEEQKVYNLFQLSCNSDEELREMGISESLILKIKVLLELSRRGLVHCGKRAICNADDIFDISRDMCFLEQEVLRVYCLNNNNVLISKKDVSLGGLNIAISKPREIFKYAIKCSAAKIIIVHNHPSGNPMPSKSDMELTKTILDAGKVLGIKLEDHVIIGDESFLSLDEKGFIN